MSVTLRESDSYAQIEAKLEKIIRDTSERLRDHTPLMGSITVSTGTYRKHVWYHPDSGFASKTVPDLAEIPGVRYRDRLALLPEQATLALRGGLTSDYDPTPVATFLKALREARRNKKFVIATFQPCIEWLESLDAVLIQEQRRTEEAEKKAAHEAMIEGLYRYEEE